MWLFSIIILRVLIITRIVLQKQFNVYKGITCTYILLDYGSERGDDNRPIVVSKQK